MRGSHNSTHSSVRASNVGHLMAYKAAFSEVFAREMNFYFSALIRSISSTKRRLSHFAPAYFAPAALLSSIRFVAVLSLHITLGVFHIP